MTEGIKDGIAVLTRVPAKSLARVVAFAMSQPPGVAINEILCRPTKQEF
jgi:NADP-dependent 3-hydroxy acid dehydrogenase YdfG